MREFNRLYKSVIIILVELRISGGIADDVCKKLGKNRWVRSESESFSKGVWCLWDEEEIEVKLTHFLCPCSRDANERKEVGTHDGLCQSQRNEEETTVEQFG